MTVAPVTSRIRGLQSEVNLGPSEGLLRVCVMNLDDILTVSVSMLESRIGYLCGEKIRDVNSAIRYALGL